MFGNTLDKFEQVFYHCSCENVKRTKHMWLPPRLVPSKQNGKKNIPLSYSTILFVE